MFKVKKLSWAGVVSIKNVLSISAANPLYSEWNHDRWLDVAEQRIKIIALITTTNASISTHTLRLLQLKILVINVGFSYTLWNALVNTVKTYKPIIFYVFFVHRSMPDLVLYAFAGIFWSNAQKLKHVLHDTMTHIVSAGPFVTLSRQIFVLTQIEE